jgi:hypothetical protein
MLSQLVAAAGVQLTIYNNTALTGPPLVRQTIGSASAISFSHASSAPFSAEVIGTLNFTRTANYTFDCDFGLPHSSVAFAWVDGHQVCQVSGGPYSAGGLDKKLPIGTALGSRLKAVRIRLWVNPAAPGRGPPPPPPPMPTKGYSDEGQGYCTSGGKRPESFLCQGGGPCTFTQASCAKLCDADAGCTGFMIQDMSIYKDPPTCNLVTASKPSAPGNWANQNHGNGLAISGHDSEHRDHCWKKEQQQTQSSSGSSATAAAPNATTTVTLRWTVDGVGAGPATILSPALLEPERRRDELQSAMMQGWGSWNHGNTLSMVSLPSAATVTAMVCELSTGTCLYRTVVEGRADTTGEDISTRIGPHAYDHSYIQAYYSPGHATQTPEKFRNQFNVSVEFGGGQDDGDLLGSVTVQQCGGGVNCSDLVLLRGPALRYMW